MLLMLLTISISISISFSLSIFIYTIFIYVNWIMWKERNVYLAVWAPLVYYKVKAGITCLGGKDRSQPYSPLYSTFCFSIFNVYWLSVLKLNSWSCCCSQAAKLPSSFTPPLHRIIHLSRKILVVCHCPFECFLLSSAVSLLHSHYFVHCYS